MIKVYVSPSCASCRKVRAFFKSLKIPYEEINILSGQLTKEDLKEILSKSDNGTEELVSTRSKIMKEQHIDVESMTLNQLLDFIVSHPTVMKRPIIVDDRKIQVGYDPDEITAFLPEAYKKLLDVCKDCPLSASCDMAEALMKAKKDYCVGNCDAICHTGK